MVIGKNGAKATHQDYAPLVEDHTLPPAEDHPHWLVIYRTQPDCTQGLRTNGNARNGAQSFSRFFARCKICGGEDRWGVLNPKWFLPGRAAIYGPEQDERIYMNSLKTDNLNGGHSLQTESQLQTTTTTKEEEAELD